MRTLRWNGSMVSVLPADIASAMDPSEQRARDEAAAAHKTFRQFDPKATVKGSRGPESLEILEGDHAGRILLYAQAWGDFNADGVDDLVLSVTNADEYGPSSSARLLLITRKSASEVMQVIEW